MRGGLSLLLVWGVGACAGDPPATPDGPACPTAPFQRLAEYRFFEGNGATQWPAPGVLPYDVIAPLYSDETTKHRFLVLPRGGRITYAPTGPWTFPTGTVLIKTFAYPRVPGDPSQGERLLETRLLIRTAQAWTVHTYVWNAAQTEAVCDVAGPRISFPWRDRQGRTHDSYRVPNNNQCYRCHGQPGRTGLLGPRTAQLDRVFDHGAGPVNQLQHLGSLGLFDGPVPAASERVRLSAYDDTTATAEARARSYLDANCGHCHNPSADASFSGLFLNADNTLPIGLGVCRRPFSAGGTGGNRYDIVPGRPEESVLVFRMRSEDPLIKMPELPTQTSDPLGVALVSAWIRGLRPEGCAAP